MRLVASASKDQARILVKQARTMAGIVKLESPRPLMDSERRLVDAGGGTGDASGGCDRRAGRAARRLKRGRGD
jgi:hypothetical protein